MVIWLTLRVLLSSTEGHWTLKNSAFVTYMVGERMYQNTIRILCQEDAFPLAKYSMRNWQCPWQCQSCHTPKIRKFLFNFLSFRNRGMLSFFVTFQNKGDMIWMHDMLWSEKPPIFRAVKTQSTAAPWSYFWLVLEWSQNTDEPCSAKQQVQLFSQCDILTMQFIG